MLGLLATLIRIHMQIRKTPAVSTTDKYITLPAFSIYLGWISVATIANIVAWTVGVNWGGWGISQISWTNIMVVVATLLGTTMLIKFRDIWFNVVIIWALYGILSKRLAVDPIVFASIITTTQVCMASLLRALLQEKNSYTIISNSSSPTIPQCSSWTPILPSSIQIACFPVSNTCRVENPTIGSIATYIPLLSTSPFPGLP